MQRSDLLLGEFESVRSVYHWDDGELVRLAGNGAGPLLAYVPASEQAGRDVLETMALVACPGVPVCRRTIRAGSGATALVLEGAEDARPLALVHDLPAATLRSGLTALLRALNHVHSRGIVHRSIDRSTVLADPSGRFWLLGWGSARPVSEALRPAGSLTEATADLRDLACAFREALLRRPWPDPQAATIHDRRPRTHAGQDLIDVGVKVDRDFARVLSRLVGCDPRETYSGATDVLVDLSVEDATAFDPWESLPLVGMRREVARVLRLLDDTQRATSESVVHAASVDYLGPSGAGKSRVLAEIARAARSRDVIVLTAEGGARGTWGGVGALARQLVQLLGRDARMCRQHEDALRHLLDDRDPSARPQPQLAPGLGLEGRNTLTSSCTAALTDMVRIAFRTTPGLLLLDDEENLPAAARDVWRASGQFVQAINGAGGVLRALLVSASTHSYPAEIGAHRVTVELRTWRQRDLEKFLAQVFASPGGTRDVSVAIHRITGGRPGDVIAYLRDLESRGALRREGLRWRLDVPLASLPALTGGVAEQVRRALDSCGRDATSLAEVLAVASDVTLGRAAVAEISDVRGPRLASAAEAAIAAGLVIPDGSAWRVRTDAIAHKLLATIPDDRRKVLHREVLQHLLDTTPDAIDPIAHHARASADPRAPAWTDQAIARAREEGSWGRALNHLDHAVSSIGGCFSQRRWEVSRADLLLRAGRLMDAISVGRSVVATTTPGEAEHTEALLLLGRACYESREWHEVVRVAVSDDAGDEAARAELRYVRAAALRHLSKTTAARREARLASAELQGSPSALVVLAKLEYEFQVALYDHSFGEAQSLALRKVRLARRHGDTNRFISELTKYLNVIRHNRQDQVPHAIPRLIQLMRSTCSLAHSTRSRLFVTLGLNALRCGSSRKGVRHAARALYHAQQCGSAELITLARVNYVLRSLCSGGATVEDRDYIRSLGAGIDDCSVVTLASVAYDLSYCLAYYAHQDQLEALAKRARSELEGGPRFELVVGMAVVGRLWLRLDVSQFCATNNDPSALIRRLFDLVDDPDMGMSVDGFLAQSGFLGHESWGDSQNHAALVVKAEGRTATGWGAAHLALSLALWAPIPEDVEQWNRLLSVLRTFREPLPIALEWQRQVVEALDAQRLGDWREYESRRCAADAQLRLLADARLGVLSNRSYEAWTTLMWQVYPEFVRPSDSSETTPRDKSRVGRVDPEVDSWMAGVLEKWREFECLIVTNAQHAESGLLVDALREALAPQVCVWIDDRSSAVSHECTARWNVICNPCAWSDAMTWRTCRALEQHVDTHRRILMLLPCLVHEYQSRGAAERALSSLVWGPTVELPALLSAPAARVHFFQELVRRTMGAVECAPDTLKWVSQYEWHGGLAEMQATVRGLTGRTQSRFELRDVEEVVRSLHHAAASPDRDPDWAGVMQCASRPSGVAMREVARIVNKPRRTLLRMLDRMINSGRLLRVGRGRGAKYFTTPQRSRGANRVADLT